MGPEGPLILAFDTSAGQCSAALVAAGSILADRREPMSRGQAERLLPMLEETLADADKSWSDLDAVAVCTGPGNFTGIRIAVAAARGLAMGLGVQAIGITLFEAIANSYSGSVLALAENRRGPVFADLLLNNESVSGPAIGLDKFRHADPSTVCVGFEAEKTAKELGLVFGHEEQIPDPLAIGRCAVARFGQSNHLPVPLYLRPPDAAPSSDQAPALLP